MNHTIQNPNLRFTSTLSRRGQTSRIILHHLAADASVQTVHSWHLQNAWAGIGYHFQVDKGGTIWQGRPIDTIGAHAQGFNANSIGIACQGDYHRARITMPQAQREALVWLLRHLRGIYGNIPISGHRDHMATACPGQFFPLDEIRKQAESEASDMTEAQVKALITQTIGEILSGSDGAPSAWAKPEWERAIAAEITDGTRPRGYVTREEAAIMAYRARRAE